MTTLDIFIVNVAIPATQRDLHASPAAIQWIVAGYGLTVAAGVITAGRLGDMFGRRRMYALGMALFTAASAACGLAPTAGVLIAARIVQGIGAALLSPQTLAIIGTAFEGAKRVRAFTAYALAMGLAAVFGQLIGGVLIDMNFSGLGWRSCFLINVPVGAVALTLVPRVVPESRARGPDPPGPPRCRAGQRRPGGHRAAADPGPESGLAAVDLAELRRRAAPVRGLRLVPGPPGRRREVTADRPGAVPHQGFRPRHRRADRVLDGSGLVLPGLRPLRAARPGPGRPARGPDLHPDRRRLPADLDGRAEDRRQRLGPPDRRGRHPADGCQPAGPDRHPPPDRHRTAPCCG